MSDIQRRSVRLPLLVIACAAFVGCSSFDSASSRVASIITPYKSDIVQGNVVTREQMALVKPGMARGQVRDILGTALLVSVFHADRWDYVFTLNRQGIPPQARKVTLFFKGDVLDRVEADALPSETEFVATLYTGPTGRTKPVLEATEAQLQKFPPPTKTAAAPDLSGPSTVDYPPLEAKRP